MRFAGLYCPVNASFPVVCPSGSYCGAAALAPTPCPTGAPLSNVASTNVTACQTYGKHCQAVRVRVFVVPEGVRAMLYFNEFSTEDEKRS